MARPIATVGRPDSTAIESASTPALGVGFRPGIAKMSLVGEDSGLAGLCRFDVPSWGRFPTIPNPNSRTCMTSQHIEKLQREYSDKYVVVDAERPEFARFKNLVGQVKTVNMGGRALVEFLDYHLNVGWYDIDVDFLKVVDKPKPKEKAPAKKTVAKKPAAKKAPAGEKKLSPLEMARAADSKKKEEAADAKANAPAAKRAGGKLSTSDILAAARAKGNVEQPKAKTAVPAAKPTTSTEGQKLDRSKMSVADMLAAARGKTSGGAEEPTEEEMPDAVETSAQPPAEEETSSTDDTSEAPAGSSGPVDRTAMSVDDMVAWCREHDG